MDGVRPGGRLVSWTTDDAHQLMAGHSKWAKVKHFKGAIDAKRARIFAKLSRELAIAARLGGGDPDMNPR